MYYSFKKNLSDRRQHTLERAMVDSRKRLGELRLYLLDLLHARGMALLAERGHDGPHRTAILGIFHAAHQPIRLETVHELRDVRADAGHLHRAFAQAQRLALLDQMRESAEFRQREPDLLQSLLKARLERMRGPDKRIHHLTVAGTRAHGT